MSELTKEYFDQFVRGMVTNNDLKKAVAPLATKEQIDELARITNRGLDDVLAGCGKSQSGALASKTF